MTCDDVGLAYRQVLKKAALKTCRTNESSREHKAERRIIQLAGSQARLNR